MIIPYSLWYCNHFPNRRLCSLTPSSSTLRAFRLLRYCAKSDTDTPWRFDNPKTEGKCNYVHQFNSELSNFHMQIHAFSKLLISFSAKLRKTNLHERKMCSFVTAQKSCKFHPIECGGLSYMNTNKCISDKNVSKKDNLVQN